MSINDILGTKNILPNTMKISSDSEQLRDSRYSLIEELLVALSNTSRQMRTEIGDIKGNLMASMGDSIEYWEKKLLDVISKDSDSKRLMMSLGVFSAIKEIGLGDEKQDKPYDLKTLESDEFLQEVSKRFVDYEASFVGLYERLAVDYMHKVRKVPNYRNILKMCFCTYLERYMKIYIKNMKFNDERFRECFGIIQERLEVKGIDFDASDNIKQSFIQLCREKYPLAKKNYDFVFDNKTFNKKFLDDANKGLREELEDFFEDIVESTMEDIKNEEDSSENAEYSLEHDKDRAELMKTIVNVLANVNGLIDEGTWDDELIGAYFCHIENEFKKSHLRKVEVTKEKEQSFTRKDLGGESIVPEQPKSTWKNKLSEKENNLIKEAVSHIDCEGKDSIVRYITKLKIKDLPLNFYDFKMLFGIKEIPPYTETILIDQLGMDYEVEEEILKVKEEEQEEKKGEKEDRIPVQEKIEIEDPTQYLMDKLISVGCIIDNRGTAKKQIDEFCQNDNYKTVLINLMTSPRFGKVFVHKPGHKTARLLRIGRTGWRMLFAKRKDGKIHFVCFANHNNYEDRLAMLK